MDSRSSHTVQGPIFGLVPLLFEQCFRRRGTVQPVTAARVIAHRVGPTSFLVGCLLAFCCLLGGCAGHASIQVVPLSLKKIDTANPLVRNITPDACYYWINEDGELCIAMREVRKSLLGKPYGKEFHLSLVLEGVPAGSTRDFALNRRSVRARQRRGYTHTRSASLAGVAAVWDYGKRELRGRFRAAAVQQSYSVLRGWKGDRRVLLVGEFTAVYNRQAGEKILARTEQDDMKRPPASPKPKPVVGPPREK
jgi:hypothetical protein